MSIHVHLLLLHLNRRDTRSSQELKKLMILIYLTCNSVHHRRITNNSFIHLILTHSPGDGYEKEIKRFKADTQEGAQSASATYTTCFPLTHSLCWLPHITTGRSVYNLPLLAGWLLRKTNIARQIEVERESRRHRM